MLVSLDWISDFVDLSGLSVDHIVSRLTLSTAEVEGIKEIRRCIKNVLAGEVVKTEKLTDKLTFCEVNCGKKTYKTVCGAPNVRVGLKAAFAPAGTTVLTTAACPAVVEAGEKHGKPSEGILCSAAELGMSHWHEILLEIPGSIAAGSLLSGYIPETDTLIEIDNKSLTHRPDLWGHYGFAREFSAVFERPLKPLPLLDLSQFDHLPKHPLKNEDYENCPVYACIEFNTHGAVPSPLFIQRRLHALGLKSHNLLVDVTNYAAWEVAQPTHAFDADKLGGIKVSTVRAGGLPPNCEFETLDGQKRKLNPDDLLIWGSQNSGTVAAHYRPVALAGVMGGLETEISGSTKKMLLECANFKAARIRKTASRLDLRTDASQRYEKTQPPFSVKVAAGRILQLIQDAGAGLDILSRFTYDGDLKEKTRYIEIPAERLETLAGINLPKEKILSILHSLGFEAAYNTSSEGNRLKAGIPNFRSEKDISIPEDIVEEVLRIYGYDNIPPVMPAVPMRPLYIEKSLKLPHKIKKILTGGHRFLEVHNYIWFNDNFLKQIDFEPGETLALANPTTPETGQLRTTLIPTLLSLVPKNRPFRDSFRLFEIGRRFNPAGRKGLPCEFLTLAGVAFQQNGLPEDFYLSVKSAVEDVFKVLGLTASFHERDGAVSAPWQTPGHFVAVETGNTAAGSLGMIDKPLMQKFCPEGGQIIWFEIELDKVNGLLYPEVAFAEPPRYPLSWQDFSLVWNVADGFENLENIVNSFESPLIVKREFLVSYKGKGLEKGTASYSFRFWIGRTDRTLTGDEIDGFHKEFLTFIKEKGVALRA
ncbi:MAG: phenylalanine--tRNA ligase subunit beta [Planctomycetaceae bacterium]|jgi:phenylalanyl-tRNA synthetase beta chain|nr:phenylalanine--tRNA ligase subunit beta [Planctomycetaceae bacterium]